MTDKTKDLISDRGKDYGPFSTHAKYTWDIKDVYHSSAKWGSLSKPQREALDMIAHKIGRILNGNPNISDHWADIAGYARLVADILEGGNP